MRKGLAILTRLTTRNGMKGGVIMGRANAFYGRNQTRNYSRKQMRRKKFFKELRVFLLRLLVVFAIVLSIQAIPIVLGISPYYQWQYEMAPLQDKLEILKRGLAVKNGHTFVSFNSYQGEMDEDVIISETYDNEQDNDECKRLLKEWGIIGG